MSARLGASCAWALLTTLLAWGCVEPYELGADVTLVTVLSDDDDAARFRSELARTRVLCGPAGRIFPGEPVLPRGIGGVHAAIPSATSSSRSTSRLAAGALRSPPWWT